MIDMHTHSLDDMVLNIPSPISLSLSLNGHPLLLVFVGNPLLKMLG